jgi:hypothetical protein
MQKKSSIFKGNLRFPFEPSLYFYKNSKNKGKTIWLSLMTPSFNYKNSKNKGKTIWLSLMTPSFNYKNKGGGHRGNRRFPYRAVALWISDETGLYSLIV